MIRGSKVYKSFVRYLSVRKYNRIKNFYQILTISDAKTIETWKWTIFYKVVRIVLYGPAISQSDRKKAGLYQLPFNNGSIPLKTRGLQSKM